MLEQQLEQIVGQNEQIIALLQKIADKPVAATPAPKKRKTKAEKEAEAAAKAQAELKVVGGETKVEETPAADPAPANTEVTADSLLNSAPAEAPAAPQEPQMTTKDIEDVLTKLITQGGEDKARAILGKYNATRLGNIAPEFINSVYKDMKVAAGG